MNLASLVGIVLLCSASSASLGAEGPKRIKLPSQAPQPSICYGECGIPAGSSIWGEFSFNTSVAYADVQQGEPVTVTGFKNEVNWQHWCLKNRCIDIPETFNEAQEQGALGEINLNPIDIYAATANRSVPACDNERLVLNDVVNKTFAPMVTYNNQEPPGYVIMSGPFGDSNFSAPGWEKREVLEILRQWIPGTTSTREFHIVIHYMFNRNTRNADQFKFKSKPKDGCEGDVVPV